MSTSSNSSRRYFLCKSGWTGRCARRARNLGAGFTLVELIVVISIVAIISSVVMVQYSRFDSQLLLRNLAFEIALEIRDAQVRGISVRGVSGAFGSAYGVHFVKDSTTYELFRDADGDYRWDSGETISTYTISRGNRVGELCANAQYCTTGESLNSLDVLFERPDPDGKFYPATIGTVAVSRVGIVIHSNKDTISTRSVVVTNTGQISVQ